jgi:uncharacterized membrane protein
MATDLEERVVALERELEDVRDRLARIDTVRRRPAREPEVRFASVDVGAGWNRAEDATSPSIPAEAPLRAPAEPRLRVQPETKSAYANREAAALPWLGDAPPRPFARTDGPPRSGGDIPWWKPDFGFNVEELLGGRLLALAGGIAVFLGAIFFVVLAIDQGWMGEIARVALSLTVSSVLLAAGVWLYERKGRTQAALCAAGAAIGALYLSLAAGTALYDLLPAAVALGAALGVGVLATALAVRWNAHTIAALGILGSLLSPLFAGGLDGPGALFLLIAYGSAAAVCVWRRWEWLAVAAFVASAGQAAAWSGADPATLPFLAVLAAVGALTLVAAIGRQVVVREEGLRASSAFLIAAGALLVGALGAVALPHVAGEISGGMWLVGVAATHAALGAAALLSRRVHRNVGYALLGVALVAADVAVGILAGGAALAGAWALSAFAIAWAIHRVEHDHDLLRIGLGGQLALAIVHTLLFDAPPGAVTGTGIASGGAIAAVAAVAVTAFGCARLAFTGLRPLRIGLDALALAGLAYVTALTLDDLPLTLAWAGLAVVLARVARGEDAATARVGALAFLGLALGHTLVFEAAPAGLLDGFEDVRTAAAAVGAVVLASWWLSRLPGSWGHALRAGLEALAVAALGYLAAVVLDGLALTLAWAALALALARLAHLRPILAPVASLAFLGLAVKHVLVFEAPPAGLVLFLDDLGIAAVALVAVGLAAWRLGSILGALRPEVRTVLYGLAVAAPAYVAALALEGAYLVVAWAGLAAVLGLLRSRDESGVAAMGALVALGLAALHTLAFEAPLGGLVEPVEYLGGAALAVAAVGLLSWWLGRILGAGSAAIRWTLYGLAIAAAAYLAALALDGAYLVVAWAGLAAALGRLRQRDETGVVGLGALVLLGLGALHALVFEARPDALLYGAADLASAAGALAAVAAAAFATSRRARDRERGSLVAGAGIAGLGLASVAIVSVLTPEGGGVAQDAQAALSALWAASGLGLLWHGLRRRHRPLRLAGLGLLVVALAKVFLYDLQALDSIWRVLSCVGLGLVLLLAALAYQRMRPAEQADV